MTKLGNYTLIIVSTFILALQPAEADNQIDTSERLLSSGSIKPQELRKRLHKQLKRQHKKQLSYKSIWNYLKILDEDPNNSNNIILFYSRRSASKSDQYQGGKFPDKWNREHLWPKSHGFKKKKQWAYTDLHHLRPADKTINSSRNDLDFGEGGKKHKECDCRRNSMGRGRGTWEPPDEIKGDIARSMFYMDVRYEGTDANTPDLQLVNAITDSPSPYLGQLCILFRWHKLDPPNELEKRRNDKIESIQGNRNPFIGQPSLANLLYGKKCK